MLCLSRKSIKCLERKNKKECGNCCQYTWWNFQNYTKETSIHGVKYLGEENRPLWERIFWIIIFMVSICGCTKMILNEWRRWDDTPVIVTFDNKETNVWKIPFPAITICPEAKVDTALFNKSRILPYKPILSNVCDPYLLQLEDSDPNITTKFSYNVLKELMPGIFFTCKWQHRMTRCNEIITEVLTEDGLCYNFNGLSAREMFRKNRTTADSSLYEKLTFTSKWNRDDGYEINRNDETYPRYTNGSGKARGFSITIHQYFDESLTHFTCRDTLGYKVLVDSPDNIARMRSRFFYVSFNKKVIVSIKPSMMYTSKELRGYSSTKRNCLFDGEKQLDYFKPYTKINCETECGIKSILKVCNCTKLSMPRLLGVRVCETIKDILCYTKVEIGLLENESLYLHKTCRCLPSCTTFEYNSEISNSDYVRNTAITKKFLKSTIGFRTNLVNTIMKYYNFPLPAPFEKLIFDKIKTTHIKFFFKEDTFLSSKRSELYGLSSFLSNCGGLLGLFMGISALSFIEIFYFSVVRPIWNHCICNKQRKIDVKN